MAFGMIPGNLDQCVQVAGDEPWPVKVEMPAPGERVYFELVDQDRDHGVVIKWDRHRLSVRTTVNKVVQPRWADMTRLVFLDRPRG